MRVAAATLGCKVNQVETASLLEDLERRGLQVVSFKEEAEVYLINTCAVTGRASYESRQLVRRALKRSPLLVVATGCAVQIESEKILESIEAPILLLGQTLKQDLPRIIDELSLPLRERVVLVESVARKEGFPSFPLVRFRGHTRAFLRVQDGCHSFCSYCVVPLARGRGKSLPLEEALRQAEVFLSQGYQELVLTGTHLALWGEDLEPRSNLLHLLQALAGLNPPRIRLSSLEPGEVTPELLALTRKGPFCPHFHLSVQSGDDEVLRWMGRKYRAREIEEVAFEIRRLFPEASLGADIIAGFPKETEEAFERTYQLLSRLPFTYFHVFPYSPRPGTRAASWPQLQPDRVAKRARALRDLSRVKKKRFLAEQVGKRLEVIVESYDLEKGLYRGLSANYVPVFFSGPPGLEGQMVHVLGERVVGEALYGLLEKGRKERPKELKVA